MMIEIVLERVGLIAPSRVDRCGGSDNLAARGRTPAAKLALA